MANERLDRNFLLGLLVGAGVGLTAALLLSSRRSRRRISPLERAGDVADRLRSLGGRKTRRAGRTLSSQIDRLRAAGL